MWIIQDRPYDARGGAAARDTRGHQNRCSTTQPATYAVREIGSLICSFENFCLPQRLICLTTAAQFSRAMSFSSFQCRWGTKGIKNEDEKAASGYLVTVLLLFAKLPVLCLVWCKNKSSLGVPHSLTRLFLQVSADLDTNLRWTVLLWLLLSV